MLRNITVICTGNICRSPIAEKLLHEALAPAGFRINSAGTGALAGHPADPAAIEVMASHGLDISNHIARQAHPDLLAAADLILGMEQGHIDWVVRRAPHLRGRVFKIGKWSDNKDIDDPYRQPMSSFIRAYTEIAEEVALWLKKIRQLD